MSKSEANKKVISLVVPLYNEETNLKLLHKALDKAVAKLPYRFEMIFIDDGSIDGSGEELRKLATKDNRIKIIEFVRNFGKEVATTAGLNHAQGAAAILIDADLQHPPDLIPEFVEKWKAGAEVVVGVRRGKEHTSWLKSLAGRWFYRILNAMSPTKVIPMATDYRLLDRAVIDEFNRFTEHSRMTRGLIDWLGFRRDFVYFEAAKRQHGQAKYSFRKLFGLAVQSFVALSLFPLKAAGYAGVIITLMSGFFGLFILINNYALDDPWHLNFSGSAILAVIILFMVGVILMALGLMALYIAHIHAEVANRPLYVVRKSKESK